MGSSFDRRAWSSITPKKKPELAFVKQRMRVIDINTSDPFDLQIILMDPSTGAQHRMKFNDALFATCDRAKLFKALEERKPIWVELAIKQIDDEIKAVQLLRCVDPPSELIMLEPDISELEEDASESEIRGLLAKE
jgi:hypothetical protein